MKTFVNIVCMGNCDSKDVKCWLKIDGLLVQDCIISSALALEILQSWTKPSKRSFMRAIHE